MVIKTRNIIFSCSQTTFVIRVCAVFVPIFLFSCSSAYSGHIRLCSGVLLMFTSIEPFVSVWGEKLNKKTDRHTDAFPLPIDSQRYGANGGLCSLITRCGHYLLRCHFEVIDLTHINLLVWWCGALVCTLKTVANFPSTRRYDAFGCHVCLYVCAPL